MSDDYTPKLYQFEEFFAILRVFMLIINELVFFGVCLLTDNLYYASFEIVEKLI